MSRKTILFALAAVFASIAFTLPNAAHAQILSGILSSSGPSHAGYKPGQTVKLAIKVEGPDADIAFEVFASADLTSKVKDGQDLSLIHI